MCLDGWEELIDDAHEEVLDEEEIIGDEEIIQDDDEETIL